MIPEQAAHDSGMMPPTHSEIMPPTVPSDVAHRSGMMSPGMAGASAGQLRSSPFAVPKERPGRENEDKVLRLEADLTQAENPRTVPSSG